MYCTSCGTENRDGTKFCKQCGAPMKQKAPAEPAPQPAPQPQYQPQTQYQPQPRPQPSAPAVNQTGPAAALKKIAASPLFLAAVALSTLGMILGFIFTSSALSGIGDLFYDLLPSGAMTGDMEDLMDGVFGFASRAGIASMLISNLPGILILVGLWITAVNALNKKRSDVPTIGLTIIRVLYIIGLVLVCLGFVACEVCLGVLTASVFSEVDSTAFGIGMMVGTAVVFGLMILYYVMIVTSLGTAIGTARSNTVKGKASAYVAVMLIIGSVFSIISAIVTLPSGLSGLLSAIGNILFAVTIFKYRTAMKEAEKAPAAKVSYEEDMGSYYNPQVAYGYNSAPSYQSAPSYDPAPSYEPAPSYNSAPSYDPAPSYEPAAPQAPWAQNGAAAAPAYVPPVQEAEELTMDLSHSNYADDTGTTVLSAPAPKTIGHMVRRRTNEVIYVNQAVFNIGKEPSNNYSITDNKAISRKHCQITYRNGSYYITDLNSSNHVYVNGNLIPPNTETLIENGAVIRLADEDFAFLYE